MSQPFLGEIRMFAGNFAPAGWALCQGQLLSIAQYNALFALLGTTYGGDGVNTFAVPDLRGRVPIHQGQGPGLSPYTIGEVQGAETVTVTNNQLSIHNHVANGSGGTGTTHTPGNSVWAGTAAAKQFVAGTSANGTLNAQSLGTVGNGLPHDNMLPFLAVTFIIATIGIFPSRN